MKLLNKKIKNYFETKHSFGYFCGWDKNKNEYIHFNLLDEKQKGRIIKKNNRIFKRPGRHTYKDFKEVQLIYFGKNLLE